MDTYSDPDFESKVKNYVLGKGFVDWRNIPHQHTKLLEQNNHSVHEYIGSLFRKFLHERHSPEEYYRIQENILSVERNCAEPSQTFKGIRDFPTSQKLFQEEISYRGFAVQDSSSDYRTKIFTVVSYDRRPFKSKRCRYQKIVFVCKGVEYSGHIVRRSEWCETASAKILDRMYEIRSVDIESKKKF